MFNEIKDLGFELETTKNATNKDIIDIERKLNIKLGEQYKSFLLKLGTLEVGYLEFYGFFEDNNALPSSIYSTLYHRNIIDEFPENLIVFFEAGDGTFFCVDEHDEVFKCEYNRCDMLNKKFKDFIIERIKGLK